MKIKTLSNGLVILYEKNTVSHKDAFHINILTGSALEGPKEKGINHLVEHLMFKASHKRTTKRISEELEQNGAIINAWTNYDNVCFYFECMPDKLDKCTEIYADMLLNKDISKEEFNKEKSIVCQEIAMYEDDFEATNETNYFREFLKMDDVAGSIKSVKKITLDQVNKFIAARYVPGNMVISVCSHLSFGKIVKIIEKYFGMKYAYTKDHINLRSAWRTKKADVFHYNAADKRTVYKQKKDTAQVQVLHAYYLQGITISQRALDLFEKVLSGGLSAILFREIREKYGVCYSVYAESVQMCPSMFNEKLPPIIFIKSSTEKKHLKKYLTAVKKVVNNLETIITDIDIERAINISNTLGLKAGGIAQNNFFTYCNPNAATNKSVREQDKVIKRDATKIIKMLAASLVKADCDITILGNV